MTVFRGVTPCRLAVNNVAEEYAAHIVTSAILTILAADTSTTSGKIYQNTWRCIKEDFNIHGREFSVLKFNFLVQK